MDNDTLIEDIRADINAELLADLLDLHDCHASPEDGCTCANYREDCHE